MTMMSYNNLSHSSALPTNRPNIVSVGTMAWLSSELMFFAGLFAVYFSSKAGAHGDWPPKTVELNVPYALFFTIILVISSFTCQMGVFSAERGDVYGLRRWFILTVVIGFLFLAGQANEYANLVKEGITLPSSVYASLFFVATGIHGIHVFFGLVAFIYLLIRTNLSKFTPSQATAAIVVSYYWHFVDAIWVILFATLYFLQ